jgi:hypothetical protein
MNLRAKDDDWLYRVGHLALKSPHKSKLAYVLSCEKTNRLVFKCFRCPIDHQFNEPLIGHNLTASGFVAFKVFLVDLWGNLLSNPLLRSIKGQHTLIRRG